jgi:TolB-like protein/Tfp pilus assembly protein PilF
MANEMANLPGQHAEAEDRLNSWKEIAAYLRCSDRTVRRWEEEGLPVHRHPHRAKAAIYAYKREIDAWWRDGHERLKQIKDLQEQRPAASVLRRRGAWLVAGTVLAAALVAILWWNVRSLRERLGGGPPRGRIESVAVLPLENLSNDPAQDYFSEGITDALTTNLAQIGSLRVISRTSAMQFKGSNETLPQIGRDLKVDAIVEGTVLRGENSVRITAQLIETTSDHHLWAKSYERDLRNVLALQDEVARDIANEIRVKLTRQQQSRLTSNRRTNTQAYDAYLRGRYLWNQRNEEAISRALGYFQEAVRDDPEFALGYSGLADCYWVGWGIKGNFKQAEEYSRRALSLEPDLAEAHVSLGMANFYQYNLTVADSELSRALDLNPNYAMAHHARSGYLLSLGRATNALEENDRARQLDPFSIPINTLRAVILIGLRRYEEAADQVRATLELAPRTAVLHNLQSRIYWLQGKAPEAIAAQKQAGSFAPAPQIVRDQDEVAAVFEKGGLRAARIKAARLMEKDAEAQFGSISIALQYGTIENRPKALYWLEKSFRAQEGNLLLLTKTAPEFDFLGSDAQFQALLNRLAVPLT